ncbi:hypothetical protein HNY73_004670 [Argiope bruennichi]|uniref:Uncharacterized protein n=1 Tax=Argiope bruennichi TaxID=94029 RepID=A0A8T0FUD2_ARGBR|nr:hypothetical protein HNY73_004670 [Argiope bruennichi]
MRLNLHCRGHFKRVDTLNLDLPVWWRSRRPRPSRGPTTAFSDRQYCSRGGSFVEYRTVVKAAPSRGQRKNHDRFGWWEREFPGAFWKGRIHSPNRKGKRWFLEIDPKCDPEGRKSLVEF